MYLLIVDRDDGEKAREPVNPFEDGEMIQPLVWRFRNFRSLTRAAEIVTSGGGKVLAFVESDRIILSRSDARGVLSNFNDNRF